MGIKKDPKWFSVYQKLNTIPAFKDMLSSFESYRSSEVEFDLGDKNGWSGYRDFGPLQHPLSGKLKCRSVCKQNSQEKNVNKAAKLIVDVMIFKMNALLLDLELFEQGDNIGQVASKIRHFAVTYTNHTEQELLFDLSQMFFQHLAPDPPLFVYNQIEVKYENQPKEWNIYANMLAKTYTNGSSPSTEKYLLKMAQILKDFHGGNHSIGTYRALIWEQLMYTNVFKNLPKSRKEVAIRGVLDFVKNSPDFD